ncbi:MAG: peptidylprolyl isomerase [Patescibacteria group bacterium]
MSTKNIIFSTIAIAFVVFIVWIGGSQKTPVLTTTETTATTTEIKPEIKAETNSIKAITTAVVTTNKGVITLELYGKESPKTVANFVTLANKGFYNGTRFHRVIKGFMVQGGDPNSKDTSKQDSWGQGGPGYTIPDEFNSSAELYKVGYKRGVLAMANTSAPNSGGSQFFIMHQDYPLPPNYTIFGKVVSGIEVVDAIANVETEGKGITDRPVQEMIVEKIEIK